MIQGKDSIEADAKDLGLKIKNGLMMIFLIFLKSYFLLSMD